MTGLLHSACLQSCVRVSFLFKAGSLSFARVTLLIRSSVDNTQGASTCALYVMNMVYGYLLETLPSLLLGEQQRWDRWIFRGFSFSLGGAAVPFPQWLAISRPHRQCPPRDGSSTLSVMLPKGSERHGPSASTRTHPSWEPWLCLHDAGRCGHLSQPPPVPFGGPQNQYLSQRLGSGDFSGR